jgi:hypothetical protein
MWPAVRAEDNHSLTVPAASERLRTLISINPRNGKMTH